MGPTLDEMIYALDCMIDTSLLMINEIDLLIAVREYLVKLEV